MLACWVPPWPLSPDRPSSLGSNFLYDDGLPGSKISPCEILIFPWEVGQISTLSDFPVKGSRILESSNSMFSFN